MRKCKNKNLNGYILPNRDHFNNILSFVRKEHDIEYYEIKWDVNAPSSIRVIKGEDDEHPYAVDPCGGPYMSVGGFEIKEKNKILTDILWVKGKPILLGFV